MSQVSITSFYRTRRTANVANVKEAKAVPDVDISDVVALTHRALPPERTGEDVDTELYLPPAKTQQRIIRESTLTTARRANSAKKAGTTAGSKPTSTNCKAKPKNLPDIRAFLPPSKADEKQAEETSSTAVTTKVSKPSKRTSSPPAETDLLRTPKRVRRVLIPVDIDSASKVATSVEKGDSSVPNPMKTPKKALIADVKAKLSALKEKTNALNRRRELFPELSADYAGAETVTIEVPASPRGFAATLSPSPRKKQALSTATPKIPAYQRFRHLLEETPAVCPANAKPASPPRLVTPKDARLNLPVSYRSLLESFRALDVIYFMLFNRKDLPIYFEKIKGKVRELSGLNFNEVTLGRIKRAFPESYDFIMEEVVVLEMAGKQKQYHLVIRPIYGVPNSDNDGKAHVSHSVLQERLCEMERRLLELVHEEFLSSKTSKVIPRSEVRHWHPEFVVEALPALEPEELPKKPAPIRPATAKEVLSMAAKQLGEAAPKIVAALEKVSINKEDKNTTKEAEVIRDPAPPVTEAKTTASKPVSKNLLNFNAKLLEKIRAREAEKKLRAVTRTDVEEKRLNKLRRLPDLARHLHGLFVGEKKAVMPIDTIVEKLSYSFTGALSQREIREHIELLVEQVKGEKVANAVPGSPLEEWMRFVTASNGGKFVRIHRDADVNILVNLLKTKAEEAR